MRSDHRIKARLRDVLRYIHDECQNQGITENPFTFMAEDKTAFFVTQYDCARFIALVEEARALRWVLMEKDVNAAPTKPKQRKGARV